MFILSIIVMTILGFCQCSELSEPDRHLFSRFQWQEALLERTIKTDIHMQEYTKELQKAMDSIRVHNDEFKQLKAGIEMVADNLKATVENQTEQLEQLIKNVTALQERLATPTIQFIAKGVRDTSPQNNQVIIFPQVILNIGNAYNPGTGVFTVPTNGTYMFSVQACTYSGQWVRFQLVADSSDNVILFVAYYNADASNTGTADSVAHYLTEGQRLWVQSAYNSGTANALYPDVNLCWNHFSGVLLNQ